MNRRLTLVFLVLFASMATFQSAAQSPHVLDPAKLRLASVNAVIVDASAHRSVYAKGADDVTPIASLTKLMTAMVTLDADLALDEMVAIDIDDLDYLKGTTSRLRMGTELPRREMLRLALMSSENRAASSLARNLSGRHSRVRRGDERQGRRARDDAHEICRPDGPVRSERVDGERPRLARAAAAAEYPQIREFSTTGSHYVEVQPTGKVLGFNNTNNLVKNAQWDIKLSKTGYIREAGKCLVMLATIASKPFVIVLLDSAGKYTRLGDAQRVRHWLETGEILPVAAISKPATKTRKAKNVSYVRPARASSSSAVSEPLNKSTA